MQTATLFSLTASQKAFIDAVCADLHANRDPSQVVVLGDGSASPNGERFAARRIGHSWEVVFNFPVDGASYSTDVQLPTDWRIAA